MKEFFLNLAIALGALVCLFTISFVWSAGSQYGGYLSLSQIHGYLLPLAPGQVAEKPRDLRTLGGAVASEPK